MTWTPIGKSLPRIALKPLAAQARVALALEAGAAYLAKANSVLAVRTRLVSIRDGVVHAVATSAPAAYELRAMRESLFKAMLEAASVNLIDLRVEIRGNLEPEA